MTEVVVEKNTGQNYERLGTAVSLPSQYETSCLIAVRVCLLAIAFLCTTAYLVYNNISYESAAFHLYKPIAFFFGFCAISALWITWKKTGRLFTYIQFFADALFITAVIWLTGGGMSPFLALYVPLIIGAGLLASRSIALTIVAGCFLLYTFLIFGLEWHLIPAFNAEAALGPKHGYLPQFLGLGSAMILVAIGAGYLRSVIYAGLSVASQSQLSLQALETAQKALVEGISEGIVSVDRDGTVTHVNQAAQSILHLPEANVVGESLEAVLKQLFPDTTFPKPANTGVIEKKELVLQHAESNEELHVVYITKPIINEHGEHSGSLYIFRDITELRAIEAQLEWQEEIKSIETDTALLDRSSHPDLPGFVGESPIMQKVFRLIQRVAPSDASILITGESGTGKELVARAIHLGSDRSEQPFVAVNCGAIPENLIESQLFGHKKGSFTGADTDHKGFFQQADGGTIFLDELGELPLHLQTKLLRALQERVIRAVGGERDIPVDVRVISATNRNLKIEVEKNVFREDLFYRLNVINISLPPLRDRKGDVPLLATAILRKLRGDEAIPSVAPKTMQLLAGYKYPGNVRELENILERAVVLGGEVLLPEHLPEAIREGNTSRKAQAPAPLNGLQETQIIVDDSMELPVSLDDLLARIERHYLEAALMKSNGVKKKAAELLGINFRSFRYRLQKFDLND
jgi:two-component system response regulator PilR (NtrC family)